MLDRSKRICLNLAKMGKNAGRALVTLSRYRFVSDLTFFTKNGSQLCSWLDRKIINQKRVNLGTVDLSTKITKWIYMAIIKVILTYGVVDWYPKIFQSTTTHTLNKKTNVSL